MLRFVCIVFLSTVFLVKADKPNIILILTDDQGFDDYGFCQDALETPVMDRLMKDGIQFTRFYTAAACAPTRASLMTGRNFMRTGTSAVGFGAEAPHADEYFLSEAMKDAGYITGMIGKWNLGLSDGDLPSRRGFDLAWPVVREDVRSYGRYEHFNPPFFKNGRYAGREEGWQVEICTDKAINFIEKNKDEPFFLYVPYAAPHEPWNCPKDLHEKYMQMGISESYAMFLGMMEQLDTQVGRILECVENNELSENTIIIFFGDNGPTPTTRILKEENGYYSLTPNFYTMTEEEWEQRNPSGLRSKKATAWENAIRNRLSIYCPKKFAPKVVNEMTLVMDIYPTIISWAGGVRSTDKPELDGINLEPLIDGEGFWPKRRYFTGETGKPAQIMKEDGWFYRFSDLSFPLEERQTCLVDGEWSLVNDYNRWGLYNLSHDPKQRIDLKEIEHEKFSKMKDTYFNELEKIKEDPHAWSDPIQEVCENAYLELECVFRMKGRNAVTWANTFFNEVGAIQELKVKVLEKGNYHARLRALNIAEDTIVRLITANSSVETYLKPGEKYHDLGVLALGAGEQVFSLQLVDTGNTESLPKMEFFSLELMKK